MIEKWRAVVDYESIYVVSNRFRVRSLDRIVTAKNGQQRKMKGRILKPLLNSLLDEPYINLQRDGGSNFTAVLRIVTQVFDREEIDFTVTTQQLVVGWPDTY